MKRDSSKSTRFLWRRSEEGWLEAAEKIDDVAFSKSACHNWLDSIALEDIQVMVSKGEYDERWWTSEGALLPPNSPE
jgi:hypothetical protein